MFDKPTLLLYCPHPAGVARLRRSWALAERLGEAFRLTFVGSGVPPHRLTVPAGIDATELPPLAQDASGQLIPIGEADSIDEVRQRRAAILLDTYRALRPDVVVIDRFPFGRRKFYQEMAALLDDTRAEPRPIVASSLHDLPVNRGVDRPVHDDRTREILNAYFDVVLVHTDPKFATLDDAFQPSGAITVPVHHTGFVVGEQSHDAQPERRSGVLVYSGGGGRFAERLYATALEAHALLESPAPPMTIVAGPWCSADAVADLERRAGPRGIRVERSTADLPGAMRLAEVSVSPCSYNTAVDIVRAGVPAVVVPSDEGEDSEQMVRAERLERLGAVRVVRPSRGARALATAIDAARRSGGSRPTLDLGGADRSASILLSALEERRARFPFAEPV